MLQGNDLEQLLDKNIDDIRTCIETALAEFEDESPNFVRSQAIKRIINYYIQSLREIRHTINPQKRLELYHEKISPLITKEHNNLGTLGNDLNGGKLAKFTFSAEKKRLLSQYLNELVRVQTELNPIIEQRFAQKRLAQERLAQDRFERVRAEQERLQEQSLLEELTLEREVPELPVVVGPSQPVIDRQLDENAHPVMNAQMFQNYVKARIRAARALKGNEEQINQLEAKIERLFTNDDFAVFARAKAEKEMMIKRATKWLSDGHIDQATYDLNCKAAEDAYIMAFDRVYSANIKKLQQVNRLLAYAVNPKKDPSKVIRLINNKANDLRALEARPIQHNTYQAKDITVTSSHIPEGWLSQEQQALYRHVHKQEPPKDRPYTCPSTIRDKRQVGQANAVRTEIAVNGRTVFTGHRHGSPSVLKINNDAERQYRTLQNVKQTLALAAEERIAKLGDPLPDPLVLNISSMSLLSPVMKGDLLDGMKQFRQVDDSRQAYWSLHGRTIPLEVRNEDGTTRTVRVQLNSTFMSIGVNAVRGFGIPGFGANELVQRVNNRGLDQFFNHFLKDAVQTADPELARVAKRLDELETQPSIRAAKTKIVEYDRAALNLAYEKLEYCNRALADPDHKARVDSKVIKTERKNALKIIEREEKNIDKLYKELANAREEIYQNRIGDLRNILNELKIMGRAQGGDKYKNNKDFQKWQMFVDAIDIYYNQPQPGLKRFIDVKLKTREKNKILKKMAKEDDWDKKDQLRDQANALQKEIDYLNKSNYRFQARFAMLANYMGDFVEWFCKSGEDRTGLLNEHIEAFCLFIEKYGCAPNWDNMNDRNKFHEFMPLVHNGAPNRETNAFNDDCPGLKVSDPDFEMPTVSYYTDKKMANIVSNSAKIGYGLFEKAKQFIGNLFGTPSIPLPVRQAQGSIDGIVNQRPEVAEALSVQVGSEVKRKDPKRDRPQSYMPGVTAKQASEEVLNTPSHEGGKSKKARPKSTKF